MKKVRPSNNKKENKTKAAKRFGQEKGTGKERACGSLTRQRMEIVLAVVDAVAGAADASAADEVLLDGAVASGVVIFLCF